MKNINDALGEKKYGIDWEKLNNLKRENNIFQRWNMNITPSDLIHFRTMEEDRVYNSKFEYWNERRRDVADTFKSVSEFLYPPIISKILYYAGMGFAFPFALAILGEFYAQIFPKPSRGDGPEFINVKGEDVEL